jgi:RNA-dependent RNA polymerase
LVPGSVILLSVCDEYDCLAEGEIYATVYDESKTIEQFLEGQVLIIRSPQVHPGDIQLVTAVRRPELKKRSRIFLQVCCFSLSKWGSY